MTRSVPNPSRRAAIKAGLVAGAGLAIGSRPELFAEEVARQQELPLVTKAIPKTGERIPVVGLGTNRYSVSNAADIENLCNVLKTMTDRGGSMVDTARVYGRAEEVIGGCMTENGNRDQIFLVTKYTESNGRRRGSGGALVDHMAQIELAFERPSFSNRPTRWSHAPIVCRSLPVAARRICVASASASLCRAKPFRRSSRVSAASTRSKRTS